jgi:transposase-like protein
MAIDDTLNSILEAVRYFSNANVCIEFVAAMRWRDGNTTCPHCSKQNDGFLKTRRTGDSYTPWGS